MRFYHSISSFIAFLLIVSKFSIIDSFVSYKKISLHTCIFSKTKSIDEKTKIIEGLQTAITYKNVPKEKVIDIIKDLTSSPLSSSNIKKSQIEGKWELIFSSLIPSGYFPIIEICDFFEFSLKSSWGPIPLGSSI